jgi:hypothetical protein
MEGSPWKTSLPKLNCGFLTGTSFCFITCIGDAFFILKTHYTLVMLIADKPRQPADHPHSFFLNGAGPDGPGRFIPAVGELQRGPEQKEKLQHGP